MTSISQFVISREIGRKNGVEAGFGPKIISPPRLLTLSGADPYGLGYAASKGDIAQGPQGDGATTNMAPGTKTFSVNNADRSRLRCRGPDRHCGARNRFPGAAHRRSSSDSRREVWAIRDFQGRVVFAPRRRIRENGTNLVGSTAGDGSGNCGARLQRAAGGTLVVRF